MFGESPYVWADAAITIQRNAAHTEATSAQGRNISVSVWGIHLSSTALTPIETLGMRRCRKETYTL